MHTDFITMLLRVLAMQLFLLLLSAIPLPETGGHANTVVESKGSCNLNCDETPNSAKYGTGSCLCDVDCLIRGDCCPDYSHYCLEENPRSRGRDPLTLMAADSLEMTVLADCYALPDYDKDPVIFVSTCRSGKDTAMSETDRLFCECKETRCDEVSSFLPVTDQNGYTYKNIYCARCNGIEANTTAFWKKRVGCEKNEHVADILTSENRTEHLLQMIAESCRVELLAPNPAYPPLFCGLKPRRLGRNKQLKDTKLNIVDKQPGALISGPPAPSPTFTASFSILMNFGFNGKTHILFSGASQNPSASTVTTCSADEIYDPFAEQCRKIHCEKGYEPVDGQCTLLTEIAKLNKSSTNDRVYVVLDVVVPKADEQFYTSEDFKQVQLRDSVSSYLNISKDRLTQVHVYSPDNGINTMPDFDYVDGVENVALKISVELEVSSPKEAVIFEAKLNDMSTLTVRNTVVFKVNVTRLSDDAEDEWCRNGHKILYLDKDFTVLTNYVVNNETTTAIFINKTNSLYTTGNFDLTVVVQGDILGKEITGFVFVCAASIAETSCPMVKLNPKEYQILSNKSMVYHGKIFPQNAYSDFEDGVKICIEDDIFRRVINMTALEFASTCNFGNQWIFDSIQNYTTAVVGILSIVTMVMTLLVYAILDQLRNLPGYCTINLTLALLLAQTLFLFGSNKDDCTGLCIAIAMTLHYLFLAAFFWMNILAYDVFRTFSQTGAGKRCQKIGRYLWKYMLYAWGSPAAIVGICAAIDFIQLADNQDASIGYGWTKGFDKDGDGISNSNHSGAEANSTYIDDLANFASGFANVRGCWIRQPTAALVAFGGPVFIIIFANAVLFFKTVIAIRAAKKSSAQHTVRRVSIIDQVVVSQKLVENDFKIYVKISTLLGFTWVFGLTSSFISAVAGTDATALVCYVLHILNLLFTLANCSQGIFIFVAFICNRRTWNLFRETVLHFMSKGRLRNSRPSRLSSSSNHPFVSPDRDKDNG